MGKKHCLTAKQKVKLQDEIRRSWETYVRAEKPTYPEAAEHYAKVLGFPMTLHHVSGAVAAMELDWPGAKSNGPRNPNGPADRVRAVARCVAILFEALDVPKPPVLSKIMRGIPLTVQDVSGISAAPDDQAPETLFDGKK